MYIYIYIYICIDGLTVLFIVCLPAVHGRAVGHEDPLEVRVERAAPVEEPVSTHIYVYIHIYIYIHMCRERERDNHY